MVRVIEKVRIQVFFGNQQNATFDDIAPADAEKLASIDFTKPGIQLIRATNGFFIIPNDKILAINVTHLEEKPVHQPTAGHN